MSEFLECFRCMLCCVEDQSSDDEYSYGDTFGYTRLQQQPLDILTNFITVVGSWLTSSSNTGSRYIDSDATFSRVPKDSSNVTIHAPAYDYSPPRLSLRHEPSSTLLPSSSTCMPPRLESPATSKSSISSTASSSSLYRPSAVSSSKLLPSSSTSMPPRLESQASSKSFMPSPASSTDSHCPSVSSSKVLPSSSSARKSSESSKLLSPSSTLLPSSSTCMPPRLESPATSKSFISSAASSSSSYRPSAVSSSKLLPSSSTSMPPTLESQASSKSFISSPASSTGSHCPSVSSSKVLPSSSSPRKSSESSKLLSPPHPPPPSKPSPQAASPPPYSFPSSPELQPFISRPSSSLLKPTTIRITTPSSPKASTFPKSLPSFKPSLRLDTSNSSNERAKATYIWVQKGATPIYGIPKDMEELIKKDMVPDVLRKSLSHTIYKHYFAALLYAEDFYIEKWSEFKLENVTLKLQKSTISKKSSRNIDFKYEGVNKTFVAFELDSARERRPFLLSRDFVFVKPSDQEAEPFQGVLYKVEKSTHVLVEFGEDFHYQHYPECRYDVSFSFNRVCLKRAHQAVEAASDPSFRKLLFPDYTSRRGMPIPITLHLRSLTLDSNQSAAVRQILSSEGPAPYLIEGPLCVTDDARTRQSYSKVLSRTGSVIVESVIQVYRRSPKYHILICAPINSTCDVLMRNLKKSIPESDIFRANAAFREVDGVPIDILLSCPYEGECFTCPTLQELQNYRVILSTFTSSFRLYNEGMAAGHFSHIFLVDASSATEPEVMVPLAHLANKQTNVVVTGAPRNRSGWVRSDIARKNGLMKSYFERLRQSEPYQSLNPLFIKLLHDPQR